MEQLESLYQQTASRLNVSKQITQTAWQSYQQVHCHDKIVYETKSEEWFVVHIYMALLEQAITSSKTTRQTTSVTVSHLLNISKMHCKEFITKLRITVEQKLCSPLVEDVVNELVRSYLLTAALFDKCSRIFSDIFTDEPSLTDTGSICSKSQPNYYQLICDKKKLIWLLYLLAKEETKFNTSELVTSFYLLLCSFIPVLKSTPGFLLRPSWSGVCSSQTSEYEQSNLMILQKLCADYGADLSEIFVPMLQSKQWTSFMESYGDLNLPVLIHKWRDTVRPLSIDALYFIDSPGLIIPHKPARDVHSTNTEVPPTPVQFRLNTIQYLKDLLSDVTETPNDTLHRYFESCGENPEEGVVLRLKEMRDRYVNSYLSTCNTSTTQSLRSASTASTHSDIPNQRFSLITRLYLRVLQSLLKQEEERLSKKDFTTLLQIDTFHRSLVVCSALVVSHTYNEQASASDSLELLLDTFNIEAYHMCKVIECFIKAEEELSRSTIQHLKVCENHILETLAWKHDSPLYDVLSHTQSTTTHLPDTPAVSPNDILSYNIGASQFLTPTRRGRVQDRPLVENGQPPRSRSLAVFLNKVCRLAYHRLQALCNALTIPREVVAKIWTCLDYCIKCRSDLMRGRHLDQIMLCCLYAISRVVNREVKFKTIVSAYENLPHQPDSAVYKRVLMTEGSVTASIITFYNQLYMQSMKSYLLQYSPTSRTVPPRSPAPKTGHSPMKSSPAKQMRQNVFISPMKGDSSTASMDMTPRSKQLYSFGDLHGSKQLQTINSSIKQALSPPSATKRLTFDSDTQSQTQASHSSTGDGPSKSIKRIKF